MKKTCSLLMAICLLTFTTGAALALNIDLSVYTDEEIISLANLIHNEIANRCIEKTAALPKGMYIVGRDIPAGSYTFTNVTPESISAEVKVYADWDSVAKDTSMTKKNEGELLWEFLDVDEPLFLSLTDGNVLSSTEAFTLTVFGGMLFK